MASPEGGPSNPLRRNFLRTAVTGAAAFGGTLAGLHKFIGKNPASTEADKPQSNEGLRGTEETGIEKDRKILDVQIRFLDSLGKEDFEAISKGKDAQGRKTEFMKLLDKRFNAAMAISPNIGREARGRILSWFDDLETRQRNTTVENLLKFRNRTRGHLEDRLDFYNTGKSVNPPDKLPQ